MGVSYPLRTVGRNGKQWEGGPGRREGSTGREAVMSENAGVTPLLLRCSATNGKEWGEGGREGRDYGKEWGMFGKGVSYE